MNNNKNFPGASSKLPGVTALARKRSTEDQDRSYRDNQNPSPTYNIKDIRPINNTTKNMMSPLDLLQNIAGEANFPPGRSQRRFSPIAKGKILNKSITIESLWYIIIIYSKSLCIYSVCVCVLIRVKV
jgi:hypothetical protein